MAPATSEERAAILAPYVAFLRGPRQTAADYVMGLFERHDVVVICERAHPETTQYDFLLQLVREPRFARQVGHVFTEIGSSTLQLQVDELLMNGRRSDEDVVAALRRVFLDVGHSLPWDKANFYGFLRAVHDLNATLPKAERIRVIPSDMPFSWDGMTAEKMAEFRKTRRARPRRRRSDRGTDERDRRLIRASQEGSRGHELPACVPAYGNQPRRTSAFAAAAVNAETVQRIRVLIIDGYGNRDCRGRGRPPDIEGTHQRIQAGTGAEEAFPIFGKGASRFRGGASGRVFEFGAVTAEFEDTP